MIGKASILLPNAGATAAEHAALALTLRDAFGAVRASTVRDAWTNEETGATFAAASTAYTVEADWSGRLPGRLERIAARAALDSGLAFVTVRHADGEEVAAFPAEVAPRAQMEEAA